MPRFKKEVFKIISYMLEEKEIKIYRKIFRQLDELQQGIINYNTLHHVFINNNIEVSEEEVKEIIQKASLDEEDLYLSYSSFLVAVCDRKVFLNQERLQTLFKYFDNDDTNYITTKNITEALARNGRKLKLEDIDLLFKECNIKTTNQMIFEEFVNIMKTDDLSVII